MRGRGFHHLTHGEPLPSSCFKKGNIPINKGTAGKKYKEYKKRTGAHSKGWKMSEDEKLKHRGKGSGGFRMNYNNHNSSEQQLLTIINHLTLPYKYVGNGKFWIENKNPDFINIEQKKVIELFGDYWRCNSPRFTDDDIIIRFGKTLLVKDIHSEDRERIKLFSDCGYQTLVVWESELKDIELLKSKLLEF